MTGVEDDEVGAVRLAHLAIAFGRERIGHTARIVDVHLAAEGLDEHRPGLRGTFGLAWLAIQLGHVAQIFGCVSVHHPCRGFGGAAATP